MVITIDSRLESKVAVQACLEVIHSYSDAVVLREDLVWQMAANMRSRVFSINTCDVILPPTASPWPT